MEARATSAGACSSLPVLANDTIPTFVYRWAVNKQAEMRDRPTSQPDLTERAHGPQKRQWSFPEKPVRGSQTATGAPGVTQEPLQKLSPSAPPSSAGCLCAESGRLSAFSRLESSASEYPASRPRRSSHNWFPS